MYLQPALGQNGGKFGGGWVGGIVWIFEQTDEPE